MGEIVEIVPKRPSRAFVWALAIASVLGGCLFLYRIYYFVFEYHGHSTVGRDAHEALLDRDAKALLAMVSPEEVKAGGITAANVQEFIDNYVFGGYKRVTVAEIYAPGPDFAAPTSHWYRDYRLDDGRIMNIGFYAKREGHVVHLIDNLLRGRLWLESPEANPTGSVFADSIERDIDILNATGIKGVYFAGKFRNWKDYAAFLRE